MPTSRERVFYQAGLPFGYFYGKNGDYMNERTIQLIGKENMEKIKKANILVVGLGGVGGTAVEALIRSGIEHITIIDKDVFDESNLNRQILATKDTIGTEKTAVCKKRIQAINPQVNVIPKTIFLNASTINELEQYDYIIDACDTIDTKVLLAKYAIENNSKIISCMGTGKRLDPSKLKISTLNKTYNDPLAKVMRHKMKENNLNLNIPVVFSDELPINTENVIGSMIFVPSTAGLLLADYVINDIIKP